MWIDLIFIGILTAVTRSFALILGVVVAVLLVRAGLKKSAVRESGLGRARRASVGCLGIFVAFVTVGLWIGFGFGARSNDDDERTSVAGLGPSGVGGRIFEAVSSAVVREAYEGAVTLADAERATRDLVDASGELGIAPDELRRVLTEAVPEDAAWADQADAMFDRLLPAVPSENIEPRDIRAVADEVSLYTTEEALDAYTALLRSRSTEDMDIARRAALESRLASELAADTLRTLTAQVAELQEDLQEEEEQLDQVKDQLEEAESRGIMSTFRSFLDELGFGFGWASLYFTVMLTWWKGQTIGKRLLRMRVLRLDGQPISWWAAFERAGGYAAGLATGLLGFAQVLWDANRQAIHDRIVGTVVVRDPPEKVLDWESAL